VQLVDEFEHRTQNSVKDIRINDYDGRLVSQNKEWMRTELIKQASQLSKNYEHHFENVNLELAAAVKEFRVPN